MAEIILVHIKGDEKDFVRATGRAGQAGKKFGGGMKALKIGLVAAAAAATALIVVTKKLMKSFTEHALKIDKINKVTNMSCESLQRWAYVAEQEHGNFETLTKSFTILAQRVVDADQGLETYTREFRKMGIALRDEQGNLRDVNDIFMDMGDYAKTATNQTEAMGTMGKILGSRYVKDLLPMLKLSREEIERLGDEAERLGIVLDTKTIRAAKAFDDKMTKLKSKLKGVGLQLAEKMLPALEKIVDAFTDSTEGTDSLIDGIATLASAMADFVAGEGQSVLIFLGKFIERTGTTIDTINKWTGVTAKAYDKAFLVAEAEIVKLMEKEEIERKLIILMQKKAQTEEKIGGARRRDLKDLEKTRDEYGALIQLYERELEFRKTDEAIKKITGDDKDKDKDKDKGDGVGKEVPLEDQIIRTGIYAGLTVKEAMQREDDINEMFAGLPPIGEGAPSPFEIGVPTKEYIGTITEENFKAIEENWGEFEGIIKDVASNISGTFEGLWDTIFDPMLDKLNESKTAWGKFGADIVKDLANMLKQIVSKVLIGGLALAAIVTLLNLIPPSFSIGTGLMALLTGMTKTEAGAAIEKGGGGFKGTVKGLLGMQEGGYVGGKQPYIVGERGPELFVPQAPGEIISNDALNRLATAMRPPTAPADVLQPVVNNYIVGDSAEIIAAITRIYQKAPRQQQTAYGASVSQHSAELAESV